MTRRFARAALGMGALLLLSTVAPSCGAPPDGEQADEEQAGLSKCAGGINGDGDYCGDTCLCSQAEGDCDSDAQCESGLVCNSAKGLQFCFSTNVDVCAPAHCRDKVMDGDETQIDCGGSCGTCCPTPCGGTNGDANFCSAACLCSGGEGDCDSDSECESGLVCNAHKGLQFCLSTNVDVCAPAYCRDKIRDGDETQIDCGGSCGTCCGTDSCASNPPNGTSGHCTRTCPCPALEGGCTSNNQCNSGLVCQAASGAYFGMPQSLGVCLASTCTNGTQDGDESGVDCGGSCLPCAGTLAQSSAFGGSGNDLVMDGAAYDSQGNLYLAGRSSSSTIDFGCGALANHGGSDIFLAKFDASGACLWSKLIGGTGNDGDGAVDLAVDPGKNVILVGNYYTTVDFGGGPVTVNGVADAFVAKYSSTGGFLWANHYGGPGGNWARGVTADASSNIIVTGSFQNSISFGGSTLTSASAGTEDIFVAKLSSTGAHMWSKSWGSSTADQGLDVATDGSTYVYVSGSFSGGVNFGTGTVTSAGGLDAFGLRIDPSTSNTLWVKSWGGTSSDRANAVAWLKSNNEIVFGGAFTGTADFGGGSVASKGSFDGFVTSLNRADGSHAWSKTLGGTGADTVLGLAARTSDSRLIVSGSFNGSVDFGAGVRTSAGSADIYWVGYDSAGTYLLDETFGGTGLDESSSAAFATGIVAVGGYFASPTLTLGGSTFTNAGGHDAFVSRFVF